jgi:1,5-anhydro-D-fructose reductase (1,5-anhydro-D-mannitol-forming)
MSPPDDSPVGWGFVGASTWAGRYLSPAVAAVPGSRGVGVFSSSRERGERFAASNGLEKAYASLDDLLADPAVEAVYVSSTNDRHAEQTIAAARAGKHVLCEKPLALSLEDARAMVAAAAEAGVVLGTNHHLRASATLVAMRRALAEGAIGEVVAARVFHARWLLDELQTWRVSADAPGAGVVVDVTPHDVDAIRWLLGDEVAEVTALVANQGLAEGAVEDSAMGVLRMRGGQLVSFHDAFTVPHAETGLELHGTTGSLIGREVMLPEPVGEVLLRRKSEVEELEVGERRPIYEGVVESFAAAVRGEGAPLASGLDGLRSLEVALATLQSAREGRTVTISDSTEGS